MFNSNQASLLLQKLKSAPVALLQEFSWNRKHLFNMPQVTNKCWTLWPCIDPKAEKKDSIEFGKSILQPLRPMFQPLFISWRQCSSILLVTWGQQSAKTAQSWPQVFPAPTTPPRVKLASTWHQFYTLLVFFQFPCDWCWALRVLWPCVRAVDCGGISLICWKKKDPIDIEWKEGFHCLFIYKLL
jgi:hypothetical protein